MRKIADIKNIVLTVYRYKFTSSFVYRLVINDSGIIYNYDIKNLYDPWIDIDFNLIKGRKCNIKHLDAQRRYLEIFNKELYLDNYEDLSNKIDPTSPENEFPIDNKPYYHKNKINLIYERNQNKHKIIIESKYKTYQNYYPIDYRTLIKIQSIIDICLKDDPSIDSYTSRLKHDYGKNCYRLPAFLEILFVSNISFNMQVKYIINYLEKLYETKK